MFALHGEFMLTYIIYSDVSSYVNASIEALA